MTRTTPFVLTRTLLLSALLPMLLAGQTFAIVAGPPPLVGNVGKVIVTEEEFFDEVSFGVNYSVEILDSSTVVAAFAVSNGGGGLFASGGSGSFVAVGPFASTTRAGWAAVLLDSLSWESGFQITGSSSGVLFNTSEVGTYSSLFGDDPQVSLFYFDSTTTGAPIDENTDQMQEFTLNNGFSSSDFVALSSTGTIVDSSSVTAVPEPSAFLFLGLASLGAFVVNQIRGRQRK